ncbi:MAG: hypothetical protein KY392_01865 [Chloroflexi bacterium]|nr:hypothetical protein [Chloroflexota bacterium]
MTRAAPWVVLLALVAGIAACVPTGGPNAEACAAPSVTLEMAPSPDGLAPGAPSVCRDQEVTLVVDSAVDGVLHIHGYDSEVPAFEVSADDVTEITFVAGRSGQFPIEFHSADDPTGVEVGVFTVHEP